MKEMGTTPSKAADGDYEAVRGKLESLSKLVAAAKERKFLPDEFRAQLRSYSAGSLDLSEGAREAAERHFDEKYGVYWVSEEDLRRYPELAELLAGRESGDRDEP